MRRGKSSRQAKGYTVDGTDTGTMDLPCLDAAQPVRGHRTPDARIVGPVIPAELEDWTGDVSFVLQRGIPPSATFTLSPRGAAHLVERQAGAIQLR
jgi:hypothetical protein